MERGYLDAVRQQLDRMSSEGKDSIIVGFLLMLYPLGQVDVPVSGADLIEEAGRLLAEFHPTVLRKEKDDECSTTESDHGQ